MKPRAFVFAVPSLAVIVASAPAQATGSLTRTFVSAAGSDANPCTITQPCASFAAAYAAVAANGIIAALDPGKYGPLTITTAVTITGNGWAAITAPAGGNGITINAAALVVLSGLNIDGAGAGNSGILVNEGSLAVENCVIRNMAGDGIDFLPNNGSSLSTLEVSNSVASQNGGQGILVKPFGSGGASAAFNRVVTNANAHTGIYMDGEASPGGVDAVVSDSIAANNGDIGFFAFTTNSNPAALTIIHSIAAHNTTGFFSEGTGASIHLTRSVAASNTFGWQANGTPGVLSAGDNTIENNETSQAAPPSYSLK